VPGSKIPARLFCFAGRGGSDCALMASKGRLSTDFADDADFVKFSNAGNRRHRRNLRIAFAFWCRRRWRNVKAEKTNVQSGATPGALRAALLRPPFFEGAHRFRKVRTLENAEDFFEGAQPFSKMRTFRCAPSARGSTAG